MPQLRIEDIKISYQGCDLSQFVRNIDGAILNGKKVAEKLKDCGEKKAKSISNS